MGATVTRALACTLLAFFSGRFAAMARECNEDGCCFIPDQQNARIMQCDFNGKKMTLRNEDISPAVQTVQIKRAATLTVHKDALTNKKHLINIELMNIGELTLSARAFSGLKNPDTEILISNATEVWVSASAFPINSVMQRVSIETRVLQIEGRGIQSAIGELVLKNATFNCERNTFTGRIGHLQLVSMSLSTMYDGCIRADVTWRSLTVRSCRIDAIHKSGISGTIEEVLFESSRVLTIEFRGLNVAVTSLTVRDCDFDYLRPHALDVNADRRISLRNNTVRILGKNAFRRLRATSGHVNISHLFVEKVRNGSLVFADGVEVVLRRIVINIPCGCDSGTARRLVMSGDAQTTSPTTDGHGALLQEIYRNTHCKHNGNEPTLVEFQCRKCANSIDSESWCSVPEKSDARPEGTPHWVPYASLAGVLLLLCFVFNAAVLLITRRRESARQRREGDSEPNAGVAVSSDCDAHKATPPRAEQPGGSIRPASDLQGAAPETATQHQEDVYMEMTPRADLRLDTGSHIYEEIEEPQAGWHARRTTCQATTPLTQHTYQNLHAGGLPGRPLVASAQASMAAQSSRYENVPYGG